MMVIYHLDPSGYEKSIPSGYLLQFAMERSTTLLRTVNHLFLWAMTSMAMLNNQRVFFCMAPNCPPKPMEFKNGFRSQA